MKKIQLLLLLSSCLAVRADVSLGTGEVFVYTFNSLTFAQVASGGLDPRSKVGITFTADKMFSGEQLKLEIFEGSLADTPFGANIFTGTGSPPFGTAAVSLTIFDPNPHWQDLQGTVRLTMLSGSVSFSQMDFTAQIGSGLYSATFPVPEPAAPALLALGGVTLCLRQIRERSGNKSRAL
jgi:hypothetical protein